MGKTQRPVNGFGEELPLRKDQTSWTTLHWFMNLKLITQEHSINPGKEKSFGKSVINAIITRDVGLLYHGSTLVARYTVHHDMQIVHYEYMSSLDTGRMFGSGWCGDHLNAAIPKDTHVQVPGQAQQYRKVVTPWIQENGATVEYSMFEYLVNRSNMVSKVEHLKQMLDSSNTLFNEWLFQDYNDRVRGLIPTMQLYSMLGKFDINSRINYRTYLSLSGTTDINTTIAEYIDIVYGMSLSRGVGASEFEFSQLDPRGKMDANQVIRFMKLFRKWDYDGTTSCFSEAAEKEIRFRLWAKEFLVDKPVVSIKRGWRNRLYTAESTRKVHVAPLSKMRKDYEKDPEAARLRYNAMASDMIACYSVQLKRAKELAQARLAQADSKLASKNFNRLLEWRKGEGSSFYWGWDSSLVTHLPGHFEKQHLVLPCDDEEGLWETSGGVKDIETATIIRLARLFMLVVERGETFRASNDESVSLVKFHGYNLSRIYRETSPTWIATEDAIVLHDKGFWVAVIGCHHFTEMEMMHWLGLSCHKEEYTAEINALYEKGKALNLAEHLN